MASVGCIKPIREFFLLHCLPKLYIGFKVVNIKLQIILKTLFNIVEEQFFFWTLMSVLYNDVQKGQ